MKGLRGDPLHVPLHLPVIENHSKNKVYFLLIRKEKFHASLRTMRVLVLEKSGHNGKTM